MLSIEFGGGLVYLRQRCAECILRRLPRNWRRVARAQTPHPPFGDQKSVKDPSRKCRAFFHSGCSAVARAREPYVDLHVDVCVDCAFFVASGVAERLGITPAQYEASGWIPWAAGYRNVGRYGEVTGGSPKRLEAYSQPFVGVVEDRVKKRARELGLSVEETLRRFLRKEIAIAGVPPAAAASILRTDNNQEQAPPQREAVQ